MAYAFQLTIINAPDVSTAVFSGVVGFDAAEAAVAVGPSPGSNGIPPADGFILTTGSPDGGLVTWVATSGQESAQLSASGASCLGSGLPAFVTACNLASFSNAALSISSTELPDGGSAGAPTASIPSGSLSGLSAGVALTIDCAQTSLCGTGVASVAVSVSPSTAALQISQTQQFRALVSGTDDTGVNWAASCGAVTGSGLYTAPASVPAGSTCTVTATSQTDMTKSASAVVTVTPGTPTTSTTVTTQLTCNGKPNVNVLSATLSGYTLNYFFTCANDSPGATGTMTTFLGAAPNAPVLAGHGTPVATMEVTFSSQLTLTPGDINLFYPAQVPLPPGADYEGFRVEGGTTTQLFATPIPGVMGTGTYDFLPVKVGFNVLSTDYQAGTTYFYEFFAASASESLPPPVTTTLGGSGTSISFPVSASIAASLSIGAIVPGQSQSTAVTLTSQGLASPGGGGCESTLSAPPAGLVLVPSFTIAVSAEGVTDGFVYVDGDPNASYTFAPGTVADGQTFYLNVIQGGDTVVGTFAANVSESSVSFSPVVPSIPNWTFVNGASLGYLLCTYETGL
jgi:hypothetical protein